MPKELKFELTAVKPPSRKNRIETYLWDARDGNAEDIGETLHNPTMPLAPTVVLIPVAAEQEQASLATAMREYANQTDCEPFSVALLLNYRRGISEDRLAAVRQTIDEAYRLQREFGTALDLRLAVQEYDTPIIGQIRKDLWDGVLSLAHSEGAFDEETGEVIGINHDIDTVAIDCHYIKNIQHEYGILQHKATSEYVPAAVLPPRFTHVRHHKPFDTHPHTAAGIYWFDTAMDQITDHGGYEEGVVMPLTHYARSGGFSRTAKTYETRPFIMGMHRQLGTIAGTDMFTSPRRYIDRFPLHGYGGIWSNETFTDTDECRENVGRDATKLELTTHVGDVLADHLSYYYLETAINKAYVETIQPQAMSVYTKATLERFLMVAENALETRIARSMYIAERALVFMGLEAFSKVPTDKKAIDCAIAEQLTKIGKEVLEENKDIWENR